LQGFLINLITFEGTFLIIDNILKNKDKEVFLIKGLLSIINLNISEINILGPDSSLIPERILEISLTDDIERILDF
jgi:hypothetical protein